MNADFLFCLLVWLMGVLTGVGIGATATLLYVRRVPQLFKFHHHLAHQVGIQIVPGEQPGDSADKWKMN
jgi:hypothetical protein